MSLSTGRYGIDIKEKTARFFGTGDTGNYYNQSPGWPYSCEADVLPIAGGSPSLSDSANQYIYIKSFFLNQSEILESIQRSTNTSPSNWTVTSVELDQVLDQTYQRSQRGDHDATLEWIVVSNFAPNSGNDFAVSKVIVNRVLNLPEEDLDEATGRAVQETESA